MDGKSIIYSIRQAGFCLELDDSGKPTIEPRRNLSESQREMLKEHREEIRKALEEEKRSGSLITPWEVSTWEQLREWWLSWTPPQEPYQLDQAVFVSDPVKSYELHAELLQSGEARGQVELALFDWIKRHARKFKCELSIRSFEGSPRSLAQPAGMDSSQ